MKRPASLVALTFAVGLCGCDLEREGRARDVMISFTPAFAEEPSLGGGAGLAEEAEKTRRQADLILEAAQVPSPDAALPGAALFDGNTRGGGIPDLVGELAPVLAPVAVPDAPAARPSALAEYTGPARKPTLRMGDVPAPNTLPAMQLPQADPAAEPTGAGPVLAAFDAFQRRAYDTAIEVIGRAGWGAAAARGETTTHEPRRVTVHHTAGHRHTEVRASKAQMREYQRQHRDDNGWDDIGYHFVVDGAGRVFEGRHAGVIGAHAKPNIDNIGVAVMGNYDLQPLSAEQKTTLRRLITFLALRYRTDPAQEGFIQPHMHFKGTACPGVNVVAFLDELRMEVDGDTHEFVAGGKPKGAASFFVPLALISPS